ncbi:baseplate wedge subunit [Shewanella phage SppYZU05]|uniref:Uncharacterized protein n=1 Tax=Shewanella phage SppYZU05 TaxID=1970795 RepID=A0A1W6JTD7_9CAUD|nr:baseplate wedge subunit [Shewanella phage SppYZU05]ARM70530.1 hypothetical protein SppYZU05_04 [Shewanella phage SppYZU05]
MNLLLDRETHDIIVGRRAARVDGRDLCLQNVKCRLLCFLGEKKRHPDLGLPWQSVLDRSYDLHAMKLAINECIVSTPHVQSVEKLELIADNKTRVLRVMFEATTDYGSISNEVSI